jgi:hypothetical protein
MCGGGFATDLVDKLHLVAVDFLVRQAVTCRLEHRVRHAHSGVALNAAFAVGSLGGTSHRVSTARSPTPGITIVHSCAWRRVHRVRRPIGARRHTLIVCRAADLSAVLPLVADPGACGRIACVAIVGVNVGRAERGGVDRSVLCAHV